MSPKPIRLVRIRPKSVWGLLGSPDRIGSALYTRKRTSVSRTRATAPHTFGLLPQSTCKEQTHRWEARLRTSRNPSQFALYQPRTAHHQARRPTVCTFWLFTESTVSNARSLERFVVHAVKRHSMKNYNESEPTFDPPGSARRPRRYRPRPPRLQPQPRGSALLPLDLHGYTYSRGILPSRHNASPRALLCCTVDRAPSLRRRQVILTLDSIAIPRHPSAAHPSSRSGPRCSAAS